MPPAARLDTATVTQPLHGQRVQLGEHTDDLSDRHAHRVARVVLLQQRHPTEGHVIDLPSWSAPGPEMAFSNSPIEPIS